MNALWSLRLRFNFTQLSLFVETPILLPAERKIAREERLAIAQASQSEEELEKLNIKLVPNDYKIFGKPAATITHSKDYSHDRGELTTRTNIRGTGDLLFSAADYNAKIKYSEEDGLDLTDFRLRLKRSAHQGAELPFGLKEVIAGDISQNTPEHVANSTIGTGIKFSTKPLSRSQSFDLITVRGTGEPGWEAELYRDKLLLDATFVADDGES